MKIFNRNFKTKQNSKGSIVEWPVSLLLIGLLLPFHVINTLLAYVKKRPVMQQKRKLDALGRTVVLKHFSTGLAKKSAVLYDIFLRKIGFVGVSMNHTLTNEQRTELLGKYDTLPGLTSLYDVHQSIGIESTSSWLLLKQQLKGGIFSHLVLLVKAGIGFGIYNGKNLQSPKVVSLFDLPINNVSMKDAVNWTVSNASLIRKHSIHNGPQLGFFINAHSINLSESDPLFKSCLRHANALFADGSGMRVAAKSVGVKLQSNINGTDMLPKICEQAEKEDKSIYFLGGLPRRASEAALNVSKRFPNLRVAGTHHGFFSFNDEVGNGKLVDKINASKADILLVGLGSPNQEYWCLKNFNGLKCQSVLAVGGLFDYYSGAIPRAPLAFRELGLEWIWRLQQEPIVKFKRYVIGTPQFLVRTFLLKQV